MNGILNKFNYQALFLVFPFFILTIILLPIVKINWYAVFFFLFFLGIIGNGVAGHRLIAHRSFNPALWVKKILHLLCTLAAYSPIWFWRIQHWHHHKYADRETDLHSPDRGVWESFYFWTLKRQSLKTVIGSEKRSLRESLKDPEFKFYKKHHFTIVWVFVLLLATINLQLLLAYLIFYWIEVLRLGIVNVFAHKNIPLSYRNFDTPDQSYNNPFVGFLTFGFGWHNNHHARPMELDTQVKWWEFDFEAKVAKIIQKLPGRVF